MHLSINVKPAGGGGGGRQGMGWGFDIFQNFAGKFPAHGQIIPGQSIATTFPHPGLHIAVHPKAGPLERHNKNISK